MPMFKRRESRLRRWRQLGIAIGLSLLLHGLVLFLLPHEFRWETAEGVYRVYFYPSPAFEKPPLPMLRFSVAPPVLLSENPMEPLETERKQEEIEVSGTEIGEPEDENVSEIPTRLTPDGLLDKRTAVLTRPEDSRISQEELNQRTIQQLREDAAEREKRSWLWLPDADTTDAETQNRRKAEEIVDRAIEAMGGLERMLAVWDKKIAVFHYNSMTNKWVPGEKRYYLRGNMFREDKSRGISWGYDGKESWSYFFWILMLPPNLHYQAERWDFLNQFKGEGILLNYGGRREFNQRPVDVVGVEDLKYNLYREAYFDVNSHLLVGTVETNVISSKHARGSGAGKTHTTIGEYKKSGELLLPYEFFFIEGKRARRERNETTLDIGLNSSFFRAPQPRTWESAAMAILLKDGAPRNDTSTLSRSLNVEEIYQASAPPRTDDGRIYNAVRIDYRSLQLMNAYFFKKLMLAGVLAQQEAEYQVDVCIAEFWVVVPPQPYNPIYTMKLRIKIQPASGFSHVIEATHRWEALSSFLIDDHLADTITSLIITTIGRGLVGLEQEATVGFRYP